MSKPIAAISNLNHLQTVQGIHPAWLEAGYGIASANPTYYNWQTPLLPADLAMPRQSLDALPTATLGVALESPRSVLPVQGVQQQQQPASQPSAVLPQVPVGGSSNGASDDLNQLLKSTDMIATDVMAQSVLLEQAQKQVEQEKVLKQQQTQVNQLQQQNAILAQQVAALKQQQTTISPANITVPLAGGGVASSNPYLVGLGSLGSLSATGSIMPSLYSPGFNTTGMVVPPASVTPPPATPTTTTISSTPPASAIMGEKTTTSATGLSSTYPPYSASSAMPAQLVYKRQKGSVEGILQIKDGEGKVIAELPARSGQAEAADTDWETAKSPIPLSPEGKDYYLTLKPIENSAVFAEGKENIGRFFPVSSDESQSQTIKQGDKTRKAVGIHSENDKPGSAGCVVLLWDTPERKQQVQAFYDKLAQLGKTQKNIRLSVVSS